MRQENDRARQQFSNPTFGYNGSSGSSAGPCVSTFSYTDTRGCSASVNGCDGTCALGRVETIASFAPVTGEVIDLKECFSGFGVNWGTGVDCGALFIPFLSSKADDIVEAGVDSRRAISNCFASFSGDTEVLMADGTTKPIAEIEVGEHVWAVDPETGESGPRMVVGTWPHKDTLLEFTVDGGSVTTTEDHHFWNETDNDWQETKHIDEGDYLLTADGDVIEAGKLDWSTAHHADAYDLTIDDIHTYFVQVGYDEVLVHNTSCPPMIHWSSLTQEETAALHTTLEKIRDRDYTGLNRHRFTNRDGQLPEGVDYIIHDVASEASNRGVRRVVTGSDGSVYYTNTHYGDTGRFDFFTITAP